MKNGYSQHLMCINMLTLTDGIKFNAAKILTANQVTSALQ
jgi:hypothetical protein